MKRSQMTQEQIYNLAKAKDLWKVLGNIPVNENDEIEETFIDFPAGTDKIEIWKWFEEVFELSVAKDLMYFQTK